MPKKKAPTYSTDILSHPSVAELYNEFRAAENTLKGAMKYSKQSKRYHIKVAAQEAATAAKTAFEEAVSQLTSERKSSGASVEEINRKPASVVDGGPQVVPVPTNAPPSNPASAGQALPIGDTPRYYPPVPRPELLYNIPMDTLRKLKLIRAEKYATPKDLERATALYTRYAIPMMPDNVYIREELLRGIPESVENMCDWARQCHYEQLCRDDQFILQARGRASIAAFIDDLAAERARIAGTTLPAKKIHLRPRWVRTLAMRYSCYLPEIGTTSYDVSLELLCDKNEKYKCLHHTKQRSKGAHKPDSVINAPPKRAGLVDLTGIGKPQSSEKLSELDGHLNCGCSVKDAILEIYLYKTLFGFSTNPEFSHLPILWEPDTIIPTHVRAFLVSLFRHLAGLDSDSPALFTGVAKWGPGAGQWASNKHVRDMKLYALDYALRACVEDDMIDPYPILKKYLGEPPVEDEISAEKTVARS